MHFRFLLPIIFAVCWVSTVESRVVKIRFGDLKGERNTKKLERQQEKLISKLNLTELLFEGDMMDFKPPPAYSDQDEDEKMRSAVRAAKYRWPNKRMPIALSSKFTTAQKNTIIKFMLEFHRKTCIRFVWANKNAKDFVYIFPGAGCWSYVGRQGGGQALSLQANGCINKGNVIHEAMHALGFVHEQSRTDRDKYVTVNWGNIQAGKESNFQSYSNALIDSLGTSYNYGSILHYGTHYFSKNGQPTLVPKQSGAKIGQRKGFSGVDIARLKKLYKC